jgi:hypothetical protein
MSLAKMKSAMTGSYGPRLPRLGKYRMGFVITQMKFVMAFQVTVSFVANSIALDRHTFLKRVLVYEWIGHLTRDTVDRDRSLTGNTNPHPGHGGAARRLSVGK